MEKLSRSKGNIFICLIEIVIGVLLLIDPVGFTSGIIVGGGVLLLIAGLWNVVGYFRTPPETAAQGNRFADGLLFLVVGLFCALKAQWFVLTFPVLTVIYGVLSLLLGICKVQWATDMFRMGQKHWNVAAVSAAATLVFAVLILVNPFGSTQFLWTFVAVSLIVEAVLDLVTAVFGRKKGNSEEQKPGADTVPGEEEQPDAQ